MARTETPTEAFVRQFRESRVRRDLTQSDVSAELGGRLGADHWKRMTITKIEAGDRGVSLDDAFQLSAAVRLTPLFLFVPRARGDKLQIAPRMKLDSQTALMHLRGQFVPQGDDERVYEQEAPESDWDAVRLGVQRLLTVAQAIVQQRVDGQDDYLEDSLDELAHEVSRERRALRQRQRRAQS
jgi:transcriptional regulator with XRE-family HTH domain